MGLGADLGEGRRIHQQPGRFPIGPLACYLGRGLAEQLDVVIRQVGEQHDVAPPFFAPEFCFGAGRFGAQLVSLLARTDS